MRNRLRSAFQYPPGKFENGLGKLIGVDDAIDQTHFLRSFGTDDLA